MRTIAFTLVLFLTQSIDKPETMTYGTGLWIDG